MVQHRPDLVRSANETIQAQKVYKRGDKLSVRSGSVIFSSTESESPLRSFQFPRQPRVAALGMSITTLLVVRSLLASQHQRQAQTHQLLWENS